MRKRILLSLLIAFLVPVQTTAQQESELDQLDLKLKQHVNEKLPGWQHRRGELIQGSRDVLVQWWSLPNRIVKVSVMPRQSTEEAQKMMELFVNEEAETEELKGLGDEAYAWGYEDTNVVFRKGRFTIYVSTTANIDADHDAGNLNAELRVERRKSEMKRLSKEFAREVVTALDVLPRH